MPDIPVPVLIIAIPLVLAIGIFWLNRRLDISRIRALLSRDDAELLSYKSFFFGPNWLLVWLTGSREYSIRYRDAQSCIYESTVLTSIVFGTSFSKAIVVEQSKSVNDNDVELRKLIETLKNK